MTEKNRDEVCTMVMVDETTSFATCPLCEATCGLTIATRGRQVVSVRGDEADVLSHGYICPKASSLKDLDADPDRLRTPMIRRGETWHEATWPEAFAEIEARLLPILRTHGRDALAVYLGNPNVHNISAPYLAGLARALKTKNLYSASTVDQQPKQIATALMFGDRMSVAVPDIERTTYLLVLGANPLVSNGSLMTAPDMRGRLKRLRERGGRLVVVDPVRTLTAEKADEHHFIRPGGDAYLLFAMVNVLVAEGLTAPGPLAEHTTGMKTVMDLAEPFTPEAVSALCGIAPQTIRRLARDLAAAPRAAVYGRIGTCTQEFGTLTSWLVDVLNLLTGNLDREGGAMFARAAAAAGNTQGLPGRGRGTMVGRWTSRVRGLPEAFGELPVACLAEEIETPGEGQVRALLTVAGNPVLSTPDGQRLEHAVEGLEFMVSVDIYLNETTRHADVILPALSPLEHAHYDLSFYQFVAHNVANYSPAVFAPPAGALDEWEILLTLTGLALGAGAGVDLVAADELVIAQVVEHEVATPGSSIEGRDTGEVLVALSSRRGPERLLDFWLRVGPYGDAFGTTPDGLALAVLEANPHGVDLGPLQPRIPEMLRTASGRIEAAPDLMVGDVARLRAGLEHRPDPHSLLLIGRRNLRSNNSWMHNLPTLMKGKDRCTALLHPDDARRLGIGDGDLVRVRSAVGEVCLPADVTADITPGVVSIPHGWGHSGPGTRQAVATRHPGVNTNLLTPAGLVDAASGNAVLNGIPVTLARVEPAVPAVVGVSAGADVSEPALP